MAIDPKDFGTSFKGFLDQMSQATPAEEPVFRKRLREHFGQSPDECHCLTEKFDPHDHANVQMAIEATLLDGRSLDELGDGVQLYGATSPHHYVQVTLGHLTSSGKSAAMGGAIEEGPVEYVNFKLGDRVIPCIRSGLFLLRHDDRPLAILVTGAAKEMHPMAKVSVEVMASSREFAESLLAELRTAMRKRNVYRGHVLSLAQTRMGGQEVKFHPLPDIGRDDIILPKGLLERVERQTVRFSELADQLRASGRHLKRGILLHGPPGTGKTLTAMYVAKAIQDRTVLLLTGRGQGMIEQSCAMARALQPSIVVLEDVDLIAEERGSPGKCSSPLLFELLNQMDGLSDDADILFLLTTNRPDILEPALAARPGRVDQAIEVPLPDEECRRRLLELYGKGLTLKDVDTEKIVARTSGASAAFIRELVRKASLFAADEASDVVLDRHFDDAVHELVVEGGTLTQSLLGFSQPEA